jgi:hypothetical protein
MISFRNLTNHKTYATEPFPAFLREIVEYKGLMNWMQAKRTPSRPRR